MAKTGKSGAGAVPVGVVPKGRPGQTMIKSLEMSSAGKDSQNNGLGRGPSKIGRGI